MGSTYKIISKLLACRMKEVMKDIIFPNQSAFIEKRQSIDGVLISNECIDDMVKRGHSGMLCKLNLKKKTYDHVNWKFLDYMLSRLGFGDQWGKWMKKCYGTETFSILLNGSSIE